MSATSELLLARLADPDSGVYRCTCFGWRDECREEDVEGVSLGSRAAGGVWPGSLWDEAGGEAREETAGWEKPWCGSGACLMKPASALRSDVAGIVISRTSSTRISWGSMRGSWVRSSRSRFSPSCACAVMNALWS